jgi:hypothetical protein
MKSVKTFIIALVLGLAGIVYAAGVSQASSQSCAVNEADCCVVGASCCDGGACCTAHEAK